MDRRAQMSGIKQSIIVYLVTAALVFYAFTRFTDKVGGRFEDVYSVVTNIRILKDGSADIEETWVLKKNITIRFIDI